MKTLIALASVLALAGCYNTPKSASTGGACDMATIETADYCSGCNTRCGADCPAPNGVCSRCNRKTEKREFCCKGVVACSTHNTNHDKPCSENASKNCCKDDRDIRRIEYKCSACGRAEAAAGNCHVIGCANKGKPLTKICFGSGEWPHGGEAPATPEPAPKTP